MEIPSRRQDHSCDQCRKGKRRCDAPKLRDMRPFSCSNCKKNQKECTFHWLSSRKEHRKRQQKRPATLGSRAAEQPINLASPAVSPSDLVDMSLPDLQGYLNPRSDGTNLVDGPATEFSTGSMKMNSWYKPEIQETFGEQHESSSSQHTFSVSTPGSSNTGTNGFCYFKSPINDIQTPHRHPSTMERSNISPSRPRMFCALSDRTASAYVRSTLTQNMIRIYHDSMENALSCWLTERNCPYSEPTTNLMTDKAINEWSSSWSNRICARICRLDQVSGSIRGRALSAVEDQTAARVLHLSIMAFASQWTQRIQGDIDLCALPGVPEQRSLRESTWNQARHALETSTGIPSFRIIFANILFSLTQPPLSEDQDAEFEELLEKDRGHVFLETAVRQMFNFRYKLAQLCRTHQHSRTTTTDRPETIPESEKEGIFSRAQLDPIMTSSQHRDTFNLLFWLGVMFDTQTAAIYQRPPVVSDEDSQIISGLSAGANVTGGHNKRPLDLDGLSLHSENIYKKRQSLWDDMLLHSPVARQHLGIEIPILPCSYEQAAEILNEAAPVKILLWRRITQLQALIYRQAEPEPLEEGIQRALTVYQHWNETYNKFIIDCVANHAVLPPRIQSWYVVLAAHWHLGALLLADVIESIDQANLSSNAGRDSRRAIKFAWKLRKDNASAVAMLAHCSLHKRKPGYSDQFHDYLNGTAFLTEPFTVLLIYSFERSAQFFLENLKTSQTLACCGLNGSSNQFLENCQDCIHALQYLGRKSDMALIVARSLSKCLRLKLDTQWSRQALFGSGLFGIENVSWPSNHMTFA